MTQNMDTTLDPRAFRRALGNFATGVTIVTACNSAGQRVGVTANSFNSVSLDPPLVLWSIDKRSASHGVFEQAGHFAVNILAADQIELSNHFARPREDKFAGIDFSAGIGGAPLLPDCAARFQCEMHQQLDGGDHWILIGRVLAFDDFGRAPLLYHQGAYSMVLPHTRMTTTAEDAPASSAFQGRLSNNLYYLMTQAVRSYQASYQPRQLCSGLRTSEARMLMVLERDAQLDNLALQREVAMPVREIEAAEDILLRKGLVQAEPQGYRLTPAGEQQAEALWRIAGEQQERVFGEFSAEQLETFKQVLKHLISLT